MNLSGGRDSFKMNTDAKTACGERHRRADLDFCSYREGSLADIIQHRNANSPMSHQTGTTRSTLPDHMIEFTAKIMLETKSQTIIDSVGIFRARQCQGKGTRTRRAATKAPRGISTRMAGEIVGNGMALT